jgi:tRNA modification GTPase
MGIEVSRRYLAAADLVLLCVESGRPLGDDETTIAAERPTLVLRTKHDLVPGGDGGLPVSVVTGEGIAELRRTAAERVFGERIALGDLEPALSRERHRVALLRAQTALAEAMPQLGPAGDAVLAAHHLRHATLALDELVGGVDIEEVLGRVFAGFCVGK